MYNKKNYVSQDDPLKDITNDIMSKMSHLFNSPVKVFYGQEPPSGESTVNYNKSECEVNYQLLAVITEVAQWGTPS